MNGVTRIESGIKSDVYLIHKVNIDSPLYEYHDDNTEIYLYAIDLKENVLWINEIEYYNYTDHILIIVDILILNNIKAKLDGDIHDEDYQKLNSIIRYNLERYNMNISTIEYSDGDLKE